MSDDAPYLEAATMGVTDVEIESAELEPIQTEQVQLQQGAAKWPGWPGDNVFRLIVTVAKVGSIIGRKGELVKKMCEETGAHIRVFEGPLGISDRVVMISGREEPEAELSPAMDAVLRVFKCVNGLSTIEGDDIDSADGRAAFCSARFLVASSQAISLIGKQGSTIKSIHESTGASVRVLLEDESPSYATSDERIIEIHGETKKVLKALRAVLLQLRKFLVDHSVIPLFKKTYSATISHDHPADSPVDKFRPSVHSAPTSQTGISSDYSLSLKHDPFMYDREEHLDAEITQSGFSRYGQDPAFRGLRLPGVRHTGAPLVTQVTQTMQVPLSYAEDIIGIGGSNIAYIRQTSGAILTVQESRGFSDEIIIEIKGSTTQVQTAQQLIQEFISSHKEPANMYRDIDAGSSLYNEMPETAYRSSSFASNVGGYRSSSFEHRSPSMRDYGNYRF
ncbi:RNA-binding KH domain-containing protein PEPPER-like [Tripterygium wilfordii]|uniref:RNA-binding KH domain-containing protein PEPPER-like n=1 Tax=Tripterygium wilfordii TaxID=458696 RepID=A0A7J7BWQ6_TRIWF|nr:RNA-binding KH domain-containing protein PEPPER-like [Tripterygium wilfordii]KAF5726312.1 RNA-binding KH domain-containing protein PEPPER-like [Tripterygium wilfordii]